MRRLNATDLQSKLPKTLGASPRRTFAGRSMNSPSASNGSFCGGNAADLQSKLPKTLSEQAKAQGVSRSGISYGSPIALVRKVTFSTKSHQKSSLDPQRVATLCLSETTDVWGAYGRAVSNRMISADRKKDEELLNSSSFFLDNY